MQPQKDVAGAMAALQRDVRRDGDLQTRQLFSVATDTFVDEALISGDRDALHSLAGNRWADKERKTGVDEAIYRLSLLRPSVAGLANWLVGSTLIEAPAKARDVAQKMRERAMDRPFWQELRAATLSRLMAMTPMDEEPTPRASVEEMARFINGRGKSLVSTLYSPKEREAMQRLINKTRLLSNKDGQPMPGAEAQLKPLVAELVAMVAPQNQPRQGNGRL